MLNIEIITINNQRIPILLNNGIPLWFPNLFISTTRSIRGLSFNSLKKELYSIKKLYSWGEIAGVDIDNDIKKGEYFDLMQIDSLADFCRKRVIESAGPQKLVNLERLKLKLLESPRLDPGVSNYVINQIANYLEWFIDLANCKLAKSSLREREIRKVKMIGALRKRAPKPYSKDQKAHQKSLNPDDVKLFFDIIHPDSCRNPWQDANVKKRNYLIVKMLFKTGIRRGELLGIRLEDINLPNAEIEIVKKENSSDDPRVFIPRAKTLGRKIKINDDLSKLIQEYVVIRRKDVNKKHHGFLFISHLGRTKGLPLTLNGFTNIIKDARSVEPDIPGNVTAHSFRHTYFTDLSRKLTDKKVNPVKIKQYLDLLGGWSPVGDTAALYTKQFIEEEAQAANLEHQKDLYDE